MNLVIQTGRLGKDVELNYSGSGTAIGKFSIAVDDGWGDNKKTFWFNVVVFKKTAELCAEHLAKGSKVLIRGRLQTRSWDDSKSGEKKYATEIVGEEVEFLSAKPAATPAQQAAQRPPASRNRTSAPPASASDAFVPDDDIPF
jgi:single-strand DNA-binding protein